MCERRADAGGRGAAAARAPPACARQAAQRGGGWRRVAAAAMFFHIEIEQNVDLEPQYFGPQLRKTITSKITEKVRAAARSAEQRRTTRSPAQRSAKRGSRSCCACVHTGAHSSGELLIVAGITQQRLHAQPHSRPAARLPRSPHARVRRVTLFPLGRHRRRWRARAAASTATSCASPRSTA